MKWDVDAFVQKNNNYDVLCSILGHSSGKEIEKLEQEVCASNSGENPFNDI